MKEFTILLFRKKALKIVIVLIIALQSFQSTGQIRVSDLNQVVSNYTVCKGQDIVLKPKMDTSGTYLWQINDGQGWRNAGYSRLLYYEFTTLQNLSFRISTTLNDTTYRDSLMVIVINCCPRPNNSSTSRQIIFYDDFGTLADSTGNSFKVWDYTTDIHNPVQKIVAADAPFRRKLPVAPEATSFQPTDAVDNYEYAIVANMQKGLLGGWSMNVLGAQTTPPIGYDHSGKWDGAALLINVPNIIGPLYSQQFKNLCVPNGNTVFFEAWVTVFTCEPNGIDLTITLDGGSQIVAQEVKANSACNPQLQNAGVWVPIRAQIQIEPPYTLTMTINNNLAINQDGNDLVMDDIKLLVCAPPDPLLAFNQDLLTMDTIVCKNRMLFSNPTTNFINYYNGTNLSYLYQWSADPTNLVSWKNLSSPISDPAGESYQIPDVKSLTAPMLNNGDRIYFRVVAGDVATLNGLTQFNKKDPCRTYSVTEPIVATVKCPVITGTTSQLNKKSAHVYPNPAKELVYFQGNAVGYLVYNSMGQLVIKSVSSILNISGLEKGIYQVIVFDDHGEYVIDKIVKE